MTEHCFHDAFMCCFTGLLMFMLIVVSFCLWYVLLPQIAYFYDPGRSVAPNGVATVFVYFRHDSLREMQVVDIATFAVV